MMKNRSKPSCAQEAMWFVDGLDLSCRANEIRVSFKINSPVNLVEACHSFVDIINRHAELRSHFKQCDNGLKKYISPSFTYDDIIDVHHGVSEDEFFDHVFKQKFDLQNCKCLVAMHVNDEHSHPLVVIRVHHIIADFNFVENILKDLFDNDKTARSLSQDHELSELESVYLSSDEYHDDISFWKNELREKKTIIEFSSENNQSSYFNGGLCRAKISGETYRLLQRYCQMEKISPARVLYSIFAATLYRLSGQDEFCMGLSVDLRKYYQDIGYSYGVNVLPVINNFSPSQSINDVIYCKNSKIRDSLRHAKLPMKQIVETCSPERMSTSNPLFNTCFTFQKPKKISDGSITSLICGSQNHDVTVGDTVLSPIDYEDQDCLFDITTMVEEVVDSFDIFVQYKSEILSKDTANGLLNNFVHFVDCFLREPNKSITEFDFVTEKKYCQHIVEENMAQGDSSTRSIVDWISATTRQYPEHVAVSFEGVNLSYKLLDHLTDNLAHLLIVNGVKRGDKVPLCFNPGVEMIISILSVLKCGACYVPINPAYPDTRVVDILSDIESPLGLIGESLASRFNTRLKNIITPDLTGLLKKERQPVDLSLVSPNIEDVAYIIYTSGSTGKPKGVEIRHRNVTRLFTSTDAQFNFSAEDVWTLYHSFAFDFSVWEIFGALLYGGRLVIVPYLISRSPEEFSKLVNEENITILNQTPTAFTRFSESSLQCSLSLPKLRAVIFGGEALNIASLSGWYDTYGERIKLINMYGITETTVHVTYRSLSQADCFENKGSLIGEPISDLDVIVMDKFGHPLPIGWPGEMFIAGEGLAKGYFNRESLTKEKFIYKDFDDKSVRLYRSGDLARFVQNNEIEYLGRIDNQVKIRGFRIELGDIKAKLCQIEEIVDAFVTTEVVDSEKYILAYVLTTEEIAYEKVINGISSELPEYMIPRNIYVTHEIPLTVNNKVDMKRLHVISSKLLPTVKNKTANTALEVEILSVWKAVLELDEIDIGSDFFSLGGNSSLILKVYMELTKVYGSILFVADLFKYRSVSSLARYISNKKSSKTNVVKNDFAPRSEKRINRLKNRKQQKQVLSEA